MILPWKILDTRYLIRDRWMTLRTDRCQLPNGTIIDGYYVREAEDFVHVVPVHADGRILVVRQYRHGAGIISTEIPGGVIDPGDASPLESAQRELLEETGCTADAFDALPPLYANPARQTNRVHTFLAHNARIVQPPAQDDTEEIECVFATRAEILNLIQTGTFAHALHIASLFLAFQYLDQLKPPCP